MRGTAQNCQDTSLDCVANALGIGRDDVKPLHSSEGMLSDVFEVTQRGESPRDDGPASNTMRLVAKVPPPESNGFANKLCRRMSLFEREIAFYTELERCITPATNVAAAIASPGGANPSSAVVLPRPHLMRNDLICLQHMGEFGYKPCSIEMPLTEPYIRAGLRALAGFHAAMMPACRNAVFCDAIGVSARDGRWFAEAMFDAGLQDLKDRHLKSVHPTAFISDENLRKLESLRSDIIESVVSEHVGSPRCRSLIHGDLWAPNMLVREEQEKISVSIIDFQWVSVDAVALDIYSLIFTSVSTELRRGCFLDLVEEYCVHLSELVGDRITIDDLLDPKTRKRAACSSTLMLIAGGVSVWDASDKDEMRRRGMLALEDLLREV